MSTVLTKKEKDKMSATFLKGDRDEFLTMLGIVYGHIFVEGCDPVIVITLEDGRRMLERAVEDEIVTADEAQEIITSMIKVKMCEDMSSLFERAREFEPSQDFEFKYSFHIHEGDPRLLYGFIVDEDEDQVSGKIGHLEGGFSYCHGGVRRGMFSTANAAVIFKAMLESGMLANRNEVSRALRGFFEDERPWMTESIVVTVLEVIVPFPIGVFRSLRRFLGSIIAGSD